MPTLSAQQQLAVSSVRGWYRELPQMFAHPEAFTNAPIYDLSGYAGTGKSTILPDIIEQLGLSPSDIQFCAPTGKAAKVMGDKLRQADILIKPRTIHGCIYLPKGLRAEVLESELSSLRERKSRTQDTTELHDLDGKIRIVEKDLDRAYDKDKPLFSLNPDADLRSKKLIICDEASMVGTQVADDLKSFGVPVLAMGDPGQLPPVNDTRGLQKDVPDFFLTEIHRQAADNPIIRLATQARMGERLRIGKYGDGVEIVDRRDDRATLNMDKDAQVIVGTHVKRWNITRKIRKALGYLSNGPYAGEPMLVCKNSRKSPNLINGVTVICEEDVGDLQEGHPFVRISVSDEEGTRIEAYCYQGLLEEHQLRTRNAASVSRSEAFRARIEGEHIDFGWVITAHKSQGSQWDNVVVHDESACFRDDGNKWLYTAITRAAKELTIVV